MKKIGKVKLQQLQNKKSVLLVDMRSPVEFRDGHIFGAVNLPLKNFLNKIIGMPKDSIIVAYSTSFDDIDLARGFQYGEQLSLTNMYVAEFDALK